MPPPLSDAPLLVPARPFPIEIETPPESGARKLAAMLVNHPDAYYLGPGYPSLLFNSPPPEAQTDRFLKVEALRGKAISSPLSLEEAELIRSYSYAHVLAEKFETLKSGIYAYGATRGRDSTREAITEALNKDLGLRLNPGRITPTHGNTQALYSVTAYLAYELLLQGKKPAVLVDERSYTGALAVFEGKKIGVFSADLDEQGPVIDSLADAYRRATAEGYYPMFYYTMPDGHNPTGLTFSLERRRQIVHFLQTHDLPCFEDNAYTFLTFPGSERLPPLAALDESGHVLYAITFSKIFSPGLRMVLLHIPYNLRLPSGNIIDFHKAIQTELGWETLFCSNAAWVSLEAYLKGEKLETASIWSLVAERAEYYRVNHRMLEYGLNYYLGDQPELFQFRKNVPGGFFTEVEINPSHSLASQGQPTENTLELSQYLLENHKVVTMSEDDFTPPDARKRHPHRSRRRQRLTGAFTKKRERHQARVELIHAINAYGQGMRQAFRLPAIAPIPPVLEGQIMRSPIRLIACR